MSAAIKGPGAASAAPIVSGGVYTIGFDDLSDPIGGTPVISGYDGFNWTNIDVLNIPLYESGEYGTTSGYSHGEVSPNNVAFGLSGLTAEITAANGGAFTLKSVNLTSAWNTSMQVDVYGYDGALQKYHLIYSINDLDASLATLNFKNVDRVTFVTSDGVDDPAIGGSGDHLVFDDFTFAAGSITGTIFNDRNGNGIKNGPDNGLAGRTVFLDANGNGEFDPGETSKVTAANGSYKFANLLPGTYSVYQIVPDNSVQTTQSSFSTYEASTAAYGWVEIGQAANLLSLSSNDDGTAFVDTPNLTRLFGAAQDGLYVSTNGYLSTIAGNGFGNAPLPAVTALGSVIAPYWDDLAFYDTTGGVYFLDDAANNRYIFEWKRAAFFGDSAHHVTFEAIVGYDGSITYEYNQLDNRGVGATVGIGNSAGSAGTTITYNAGVLLSHSAYTLTPEVSAPAAIVQVNSGQATKVDFGTTPASNPNAPHAPPVAPHAFAGVDSPALDAFHMPHHAMTHTSLEITAAIV